MQPPGATLPAFCWSNPAQTCCLLITLFLWHWDKHWDNLSMALGQIPQSHQHRRVIGHVLVTSVHPQSSPACPTARHL